MIELYLSSDGKHTVKVSAQDRQEMNKLSPYAKQLYESVLAQYGTKAQMWEQAMNGNGRANHNRANGASGQTGDGNAPICPIHNVPMKYRSGTRGPFWSCAQKLPDGRWCNQTAPVNGEAQ